ncbi:fungal-specific transcription factor domain-containing protein [Aspergillus ambiguus]|uniref:Zn(II)2Cys6 transcription factor n=1 Tax=Aspergillus ambiguus TaxID=176160 RepID=UPI003CCDB64E
MNNTEYSHRLLYRDPALSSSLPEDRTLCDDWTWTVRLSSQLPVWPPGNFAATRDDAAMQMTSATPILNPRSSNPKMPIPRSANSRHWTPSGRVKRACDNCREQKVKCSGDHPVCQRCQEAGFDCLYGDGKRAKIAKELSDLTDQVHAYKSLLRDIYPKLDSKSAERVADVFSETIETENPLVQHAPASSDARSNGDSSKSSHTPAAHGSLLRALDYTCDDFNSDTAIQAVGYVGEHSETAWMRRLKQILAKTGSYLPTDNRPSIASVAYSIDKTNTRVIDNISLSQRPPQNIANQLIDCYFKVVHPSFPIINKRIFLGQYSAFFSTSVNPGRRWLAILNLIFAISTKCFRYTQVASDNGGESETSETSETAYFSRAWKLSMHNALLEHPSLQQVQVEGLISFYLMSAGQISRSWRFCTIATGSAIALGLHIRNDGDAINHISRETRYRIWWSLRSLDVSLCLMTGRPLSSSNDFCATPLPLPFTEEELLDTRTSLPISDHGFPACAPTADPDKQHKQDSNDTTESARPSSSLYFRCLIDLDLILGESIDTLYAPPAVRKSWSETQVDIAALIGKIDTWLSRLPVALHFTQGSNAFTRERSSLAFRFYSTKIVITQPCLSGLAETPTWVESPPGFSEEMSATCIDLAVDVLDLLPDQPSFSWISGISPWFYILHYLMQSIAVLLFGLFLAKDTATTEYSRLQQQVSKAMLWLTAMSTRDQTSLRALSICTDLLSYLVPRTRRETHIAIE